MIPCLPTQDPKPASRRAAVARDRERYQIQHAYKTQELPNGFALADHVGEADQFSLLFFEKQASVDMLVAANAATTISRQMASHGLGAPQGSLLSLLGLERAQASGAPFPRTRKALSGVEVSFPPDLAAYESVFSVLPLPTVAGVVRSSAELQDRLFAWQRVAGANPLVLRAVRRIPPRDTPLQSAAEVALNLWQEWFGEIPADATTDVRPEFDLPPAFLVSDADVQRTLPTETLASLAGTGRLFLCDYAITTGIPTGTYNSGLLGITRQKYLCAPFALFAWVPACDARPGYLAPLAIQCDRVKFSPHVFTPADGIAWKMAKTVVQQADSTVQELVSHLARTHLLAEAVILCARRELAPWHPLRTLIDAHAFNTLAINDYAAHHLIAPGGDVDRLFSATLEGNLELATRGLAGFTFANLAPPDQLAARGLDGSCALTAYPWRDDAILLWPIVERFVERYVKVYYASNDDVSDDAELRAFVAALSSPAGGALGGIPEVASVQDVVWLCARFVWTVTLQHGCLNNAQFDQLGYVPATPGALYAPAPQPGQTYAETDWMKMLPPVSAALEQGSLLYQLANVRIAPMGHFPEGAFIDPRVQDPIRRYQRELAWADSIIVGRDQTRFLPYPFLRPSQVGNSVFI